MNSPEFIFMINQRLALPYAYNRIFYNTICNFLTYVPDEANYMKLHMQMLSIYRDLNH